MSFDDLLIEGRVLFVQEVPVSLMHRGKHCACIFGVGLYSCGPDL